MANGPKIHNRNPTLKYKLNITITYNNISKQVWNFFFCKTKKKLYHSLLVKKT